MACLVEIQETEQFGKAVIALKDLDPAPNGIEVLREKAVIVFPIRGGEHDKSGPPPWPANPCFDPQWWSDYWQFKQQDDDTKEAILDFFVEMDSKANDKIREFLMNYSSLEDIETFLRVWMVRKFNAVAMNPPTPDGTQYGKDYGSGLFEVACRMAHSCHPNCTWFSSQDGTEKIVRSIRPIKAGDMLTVDYLGKPYNTTPIDKRSERLLATKNFACNCERCASVQDDTRRFHCQNKKCRGVHFASKIEESSMEPKLLNCTVCGKQASEDFQRTMFRKEAEAQKSFVYLDHISGSQDVTSQLLRLVPLHPLHSIGLHIYEAQFEIYSQMREFSKAAYVQRKRIACWAAIFGDDTLNELVGFDYERLGDVYDRADNLSKAEEAYQTAVRCFQCAYGDTTHPYYMCGISKLLSVQKRSGAGQPHPGHCGLCNMVATQRCGRCRNEVYCTRDHQKSHWIVHKKTCKLQSSSKQED